MEPIRAEPLEALRRRTSEKWSLFGPEYLPMFVAEMDFPLAPAITSELHRAVDAGDTGYLNPRDTSAHEALADFAEQRWGWRPPVSGMATTTDVSVVVVESLRHLIAPGDGVVIMPPVYPPFFDFVTEAGGSVVEVPLADHDGQWSLDLDGIDAALAAGAKGVLLCSPHNPLGLVHPREQLVTLSEIVERHGGFVVSDEIHAPLTHSDAQFVPYLSVSDAAREHGISALSGSKAFNLAGLKCAFFSTAADRMKVLVRGLPEEVVFRTGLFGAMATRAGFADGRDWLDGVVASLETNRRLLTELLADRMPRAVYREPRASYLAWLDLRAYPELGDDPARIVRRRTKLVMSNGPHFGSPGVGFARLNIACSPEVLVEAVDRLATAAAGAASATAP